MEQLNRKSTQGILNIIQFNYHYFLMAIFVLVLIFFLKLFIPANFHIVINIVIFIIATITIGSLVGSHYIYDLAGFYELKWMDKYNIKSNAKIVNINAGFDETSHLIKRKYPSIDLQVIDFYDEQNHNEVSIKRARKKYQPYPNTKHIKTNDNFLQKNTIDFVFCILSAHEIRNDMERIVFFNQLKNSISDDGKIIVVEHLRDQFNALAYTIGAFHFLSHQTWLRTFKKSGLIIESQQKFTPFLTIYNLKKHGVTS